MTMRPIMLAAIIVICTSAVQASEPPRLKVREAIALGQMAFIGRVTRLEEVERGPFFARAAMTVDVMRCLYGPRCKPGKPVTLSFFSQRFAEGAYPVDFGLSEEVLFVLRGDLDGRSTYVFDSELAGGTDLAFRGDKLPLYEKTESTIFSSVFDGSRESIRHEDLENWSSARRVELDTKKPR